MSESRSRAFDLLDERIRRYIWSKGWGALREAQEHAIPLIVPCDRDVIIAAATAAGKTEAAFLPALTHLLAEPESRLIVYVSPLKALINDQFGRLQLLCEDLEIPVWPWHGDIAASVKQRFAKSRHGVVLITPESLEAMLCRRGSAVATLFGNVTCFIIDELHAFIGSERGKQMQTLLHRIELLLGRTVPRIGLSATIGDIRLAAEFMRPSNAEAVSLVESRSSGGELRVLVRGLEQKMVRQVATADDTDAPDDDDGPDVFIGSAQAAVATELFNLMRGSNNLIFPNSRREVETYTYLLKKLCEDRAVPVCFWPHHGSLSKHIREETEAALKEGDRPATAICTSTLELGIDIGAVKCVAQIGPPPSVASLRQRLGRSGRRDGEAAILRGFVIEDELDERSSMPAQLRLDLVQMIAMIELLIGGWFEPPRRRGLHFSTLIQQLMACIAQYGGCSAADLYRWLCSPGAPFDTVSVDQFKRLLKHLGEKEVLMQESDGTLLHGRVGEAIVNHYTFYAAFATDIEYRIIAGNKTLGTLPVNQMLAEGQRILFAGKTWRIASIDEATRTINVVRQSGGMPPLFAGGVSEIHRRVREQMREVLAGAAVPSFLDAKAAKLLAQGREAYRGFMLDKAPVIDLGSSVVLVVWDSDAVVEGIVALLRWVRIAPEHRGPIIEFNTQALADVEVSDFLCDLGATPLPDLETLLERAGNLEREKWDNLLPLELLHAGLIGTRIDLDGAQKWLAAAGAAVSQRTPD